MSPEKVGSGLIYHFLHLLASPFINRVRAVDVDVDALKRLNEDSQVIYVSHVVSFIDHLILSHFLRKNGLPAISFTQGLSPFMVHPFLRALGMFFSRFFRGPEWVAQWEMTDMRTRLKEGQVGHLFLKRGPGILGSPFYYHGFLEDVVQHANDKHVVLLPTSFFLTRKRRKNAPRSLYDIFFGSYDIPGRVRKCIQLVMTATKGAIIFSKPIDLNEDRVRNELEARNPESHEKRLRWTLLFHLNNEDRAYRGPTKRTTERKVRRILKERKLKTELEKVAERQNRDFESVFREAKKELFDMASDTSEKVINALRMLFDVFWARSLEGFDYLPEDLRRIRELNKKGPIVFLPCHRSHADYLVVAYLFEREGLNNPRFAAGDNLAKWPLGPVLRRAGAFFIRRSFKGETIFPLVLDAYVRYILRERNVFIFFMEGGRSRTGKLLHPKVGLLGMVLDAWQQGVVDDVPLMPMTIDYGKVFEGQAYIKEKGGGEKEREGLKALLKTRKFFFLKHGVVRLRCGEPIMLSQFLAQRGLGRDDLGFKTKLPTLNALGFEAMNHINRMVTLTAGNIVASILMSTPARGMTLANLKDIFILAVRYLRQRKAELTFTEQRLEIALENAIETFVQWETVVRVEVAGEVVISIPENKRAEMEYYKNNGIHFMLDLALLSFALKNASPVRLTKDQALQVAREVYEFLSLEFIKPENYPDELVVDRACKTLEAIQAIEFNEGGRIMPGQAKLGVEVVLLNAFMLKNFFESYFAVAELLTAQGEGETPNRKEFLRQCVAKAELLYQVGTITRREAINKVSFENALYKFNKMGFIRLQNIKGQKHPQIVVVDKKREEFKAVKDRLFKWMFALG